MPVAAPTILNDASTSGAGGGWRSNHVDYIWLGEHYGTIYSCAGWHLKIDANDVPADTADITAASLTIRRENSTGLSNMTCAVLTDVGASMPWSDSGGNRPVDDYATAKAQNGYVAWDIPSGSANDYHESPNLASLIRSAISNSSGPVGGYYYIGLICNFDTSLNTANAVSAFQCRSVGDTDSASRPTFSMTTAAPANFTATLPSISPTTTVGRAYGKWTLPYHGVSALGTSDGGSSRVLDFYGASTGAGARPTVMFVHGGAWVGGYKEFSSYDTNGIQRLFVQKMTELGYNVVSVGYRLFSGPEIFYGDIDYSFPQNVHDVRAAMEYLGTNSADLKIDTDKFVVGGHSAGGHLTLFAGLTACNDDSDQYTGKQNANGDRPAGYGLSDTASPWKFDFDENGELSSTLKPCGIMAWDAPVDEYETTTAAGLTGTLSKAARQVLFAQLGGSSNPPATYDECDINHYIAQDGTTSYTGTPMDPADIPPIFFMYSTAEDVVINSASIDALETALDAVSYDTSTAVNVLNSGGLSKYSTSSIHGNVIVDQGPDFDEEVAWLEEVFSSVPIPAKVGSTQIDALKVGSSDVDALYYGSTLVWP